MELSKRIGWQSLFTSLTDINKCGISQTCLRLSGWLPFHSALKHIPIILECNIPLDFIYDMHHYAIWWIQETWGPYFFRGRGSMGFNFQFIPLKRLAIILEFINTLNFIYNGYHITFWWIHENFGCYFFGKGSTLEFWPSKSVSIMLEVVIPLDSK